MTTTYNPDFDEMYVIAFTGMSGTLSAEIVKSHYPKAKHIIGTYSKTFPNTIPLGAHVFVIGMEYPNIMNKLNVDYNIVWITNHTVKPGMENIPGMRAEDSSSCILTWKYFNGDVEPPRALQLADDYEMWRFKYEDSLAFFYGFSTLPFSSSNDSGACELVSSDMDVASSRIANTIAIGKQIHAYNLERDKIMKSITYRAEVNIGGKNWKILCANIRGVNSLSFDTCKSGNEDVDLYLIYGYNHRLKKWLYSVYSNGGDAGEFARCHHGNGKHGAGGFRSESLYSFLMVPGKGIIDDSEINPPIGGIVVKKYLEKNHRITFNTSTSICPMFDTTCVIINSPYTWDNMWDDYDILSNINVRIGVSHAYVKSGHIRILITAQQATKEELQDIADMLDEDGKVIIGDNQLLLYVDCDGTDVNVHTDIQRILDVYK